jgi:hypothetical protein
MVTRQTYFTSTGYKEGYVWIIQEYNRKQSTEAKQEVLGRE